MRQFDYVVVGAGYAGSVLAERIASQLDRRVLVIDRRPHIGGNAYDYYNEHGIQIHEYGPHIFHTNSVKVFKYLSQFTQWRPYEHRVLASAGGQLVPMPVNRTTINRVFGLDLDEAGTRDFLERVREPRARIENSEDVVVSKVGWRLYELLFRGYTTKQWELDPSQLSPSVCGRIPIRTNADDRYFTDSYQAIPLRGYTNMFRNILSHRNISVMLQTEFRDVEEAIPFDRLIYTGAIDEFFDYVHGPLPYRSLYFEHETLEVSCHQPVAQINYPNEHDYTRITEWKHITGQEHHKTTITREYPRFAGRDDPKYYPVPREESQEVYERYLRDAHRLKGVTFCGRLADYKYYNMDQITARALSVFENEIAKS